MQETPINLHQHGGCTVNRQVRDFQGHMVWDTACVSNLLHRKNEETQRSSSVCCRNSTENRKSGEDGNFYPYLPTCTRTL